mmetsp:Transcript_18109/g.34472  ORF Transcript_18109/g.34472 Transcript_18109/m.34472 type:complete len:418 (-) Transcript_18109:130-1383(-)
MLVGVATDGVGAVEGLGVVSADVRMSGRVDEDRQVLARDWSSKALLVLSLSFAVAVGFSGRSRQVKGLDVLGLLLDSRHLEIDVVVAQIPLNGQRIASFDDLLGTEHNPVEVVGKPGCLGRDRGVSQSLGFFPALFGVSPHDATFPRHLDDAATDEVAEPHAQLPIGLDVSQGFEHVVPREVWPHDRVGVDHAHEADRPAAMRRVDARGRMPRPDEHGRGSADERLLLLRQAGGQGRDFGRSACTLRLELPFPLRDVLRAVAEGQDRPANLVLARRVELDDAVQSIASARVQFDPEHAHRALRFHGLEQRVVVRGHLVKADESDVCRCCTHELLAGFACDYRHPQVVSVVRRGQNRKRQLVVEVFVLLRYPVTEIMRLGVFSLPIVALLHLVVGLMEDAHCAGLELSEDRCGLGHGI